MLDANYYGFHIWQNNDVVPIVNEDRARIWYKRYRLWDSDTTIKNDIAKVKALGNYRYAARMRAIPWTASEYPPDSVKPYYIKTNVNGTTIYIPKYYDSGFRQYYEDRVTHFRDLITASSIEIAFMDMDGMGRGGEAHTYQIALTDAQQPNSEVRSWSLYLYIRLFGKDKVIVQTDRGDVVKDAISKGVLGWRRDSLGRASYIDGLKDQGIYNDLLEWKSAYVVGELFGESGIDAQLAVNQAREMGVDTMGNGNYTKTYDQMSTSEKNLWKAFAHELKLRYAIENTETPPPVPVDPVPPIELRVTESERTIHVLQTQVNALQERVVVLQDELTKLQNTEYVVVKKS